MRPPPKWTEFASYPVTSAIAILTAAITVAWWFGVDISKALETAEIRRWELWRLLTSIFPHLSPLHLAFNLYWFWVFGTVVERTYASARTVGLLLLFALGSSSVDFALAEGGVGLSGVAYGLFGLLWMLSRRDDRFRNAVDDRTISLFVVWFFICIGTTVTGLMPVANVAHGTGAVLGVLMGLVITMGPYRRLAVCGACGILLLGLWGSTFGRPMVNLSGKAGYEEGQWGYEALLANHNEEAVRWFRDAARLQPQIPEYRANLGIAYHRLGNLPAAKDAYQRAHELDPSNPAYAVPKLE